MANRLENLSHHVRNHRLLSTVASAQDVFRGASPPDPEPPKETTMTKIQRPATPTELDLMLMRGGWPSQPGDIDATHAAQGGRLPNPWPALRRMLAAARRIVGQALPSENAR
jgi:hypothetical protein